MSASSNPRGLSGGTAAGGGSTNDVARIHRAIDNAGFKSAGVNGQWELDTPYGGAQILDETGAAGRTFGYKEYGVSIWDAEYNMLEDGQTRESKRFESLNEAKRYAKDLLKRQYR